MNKSILVDLQICISVPLIEIVEDKKQISFYFVTFCFI